MALQRPSELIARHANALAGERGLLMINAPADELPRLLWQRGARAAMLFNQHHGDHCFHRAALPPTFGSDFGPLPDSRDCSNAVLFLPREKVLARLLIRAAAAALRQGGKLWVVGENRAGGRSAGKLLGEQDLNWRKRDVARHCSLYEATMPRPPTPPRLEDHQQSWRIEFAGEKLTVVSLPGVFSHGELDTASRLLIDHLPALTGSVLDFGCGSGVLGLACARRGASAVHLLDHSALALASSAATFAANGLAPAGLIASDGLAQVDTDHDLIISNPPFHRGVATDYRTTHALIERAPDYLNDGGRLLLVANSFLDYDQRIRQRFGHCETLASNRGFSVYQGQLR